MKSLLVSSVSALALLAGAMSAQAADIPARAPVKAPPPVVAPVFTWTGPYVGISGGYGWGDSDRWGGGAADTIDVDGWIIGLTAGYNWQVNQIVFGIEGDISWTDISGGGPCVGVVTRGCSTQNDWLGTVRGRLGWAAGQFMPYITGGLAVGNIDARLSGSSVSNTNAGWTLGAGIEAALWGPVSAKIEYLYVDLGGTDGFPAFPGGGAEFTTNIVRVGLNYRF